MRKTLSTLALAAVLLTAPGMVPEARADHSRWTLGTGFSIGHFVFNIVLGSPYRSAHAGYYFRARDAFHYDGYTCNRSCFKEQDHYYHDPQCPALLHHFKRHRQNPYDVFESYAPYDDEPVLQYRDHRERRSYRDRSYNDHDHNRRYRGGHGSSHRSHRSHGRACPYRPY